MTSTPEGAGLFTVGSDAYDRHMGRYSRELAGPLIALAGVSPGMSVLDVGCGTGALTCALADLLGPERVAAVDPSAAFAATCRSRAGGAEVLVAAAESLPFANERFDVVLSQLVVNFVDDPHAAVLYMRRVARPGAVIAGCVWDYRAGMTLLRSFWDGAIDLGLPNAAARDQGRTMPFCTPGELLALWERAELDEAQTGEIAAAAEYTSFDDLRAPYDQGISPAGVYVTSLSASERDALRAEVFRRLGSPPGSSSSQRGHSGHAATGNTLTPTVSFRGSEHDGASSPDGAQLTGRLAHSRTPAVSSGLAEPKQTPLSGDASKACTRETPDCGVSWGDREKIVAGPSRSRLSVVHERVAAGGAELPGLAI